MRFLRSGCRATTATAHDSTHHSRAESFQYRSLLLGRFVECFPFVRISLLTTNDLELLPGDLDSSSTHDTRHWTRDRSVVPLIGNVTTWYGFSTISSPLGGVIQCNVHGSGHEYGTSLTDHLIMLTDQTIRDTIGYCNIRIRLEREGRRNGTMITSHKIHRSPVLVLRESSHTRR